MKTDIETLKRARAWCSRQFAKRYDRSAHASHLACEILLEAEAKFELGTMGDEGWCDDAGNEGVDYLNTGDSYAPTLCVRTSRYSASFMVASWADLQQQGEANDD